MSNLNEQHHTADEKKGGTFVGFVLLDDIEWDKQEFIKGFEDEWNLHLNDNEDEDEDPEKASEMLFANVGSMILTVMFVPAPIPDGEAEYWSKGNYMWKEAEQVVSAQKAHLIVTVLGGGDDYDNTLDKGKLFVKAVCTALQADNAIAFYNEGAVFSPRQYLDFSELMGDNGYPLLNWIWFGIYANEKQAGVYTYGMSRFGKDEMEVYADREKADFNNIRGFLLDIVSYVIIENVTLKDGETIGFSAEQKLPIKLSPGIALDGKTLKIEYGE